MLIIAYPHSSLTRKASSQRIRKTVRRKEEMSVEYTTKYVEGCILDCLM